MLVKMPVLFALKGKGFKKVGSSRKCVHGSR